jgi:histidine ammonia-lyase
MLPQNKFLEIGNDNLSLSILAYSINQNIDLKLHPKAIDEINKCHQYLFNKLQNNNQLFYGINTGFGYMQHVAINAQQTQQLQYNLLLSHACGMGSLVPQPIIKLMLLLKIKSLSAGYSGVQLQTVERLVDFYNNNILPVVYTQGSLGASGDLAPLSHLSLPLINEGSVWLNNQQFTSKSINQKNNWQPINLQHKEGLALINGTQFMSAYGMYCLYKSEKLLNWATTIAAISIDAFGCTTEPFNELIHKIRPHTGQIKVATQIRELLQNSALANASKKQVQDPYSFRCIPQVHGASWDTFNYVQSVFETEINAVTDNPNIFYTEDEILSGGNFHGQPLALALDFLAIAMSEIGSISERRTYQLISGSRGLPLFLVENAGLNSGLMIPQYTAASIVSQNKQLCTPASVDTISSSNNQEDHVSMGANAATKCLQVVENIERILAIELLTAIQALEFRRPAKSSTKIEAIVKAFREQISFNTQDRLLHIDLTKAVAFIQNHNL